MLKKIVVGVVVLVVGGWILHFVTNESTSKESYRRYIAVRSEDKVFGADDFLHSERGGSSKGSSLVVPSSSGDGFIAFALPAYTADPTSIYFVGSHSLINFFEKIPGIIMIDGREYVVWASFNKLSIGFLSGSELVVEQPQKPVAQ